MLTNITFCLDNDGAATPLQTFNQNPNLPPGITVGQVNHTDAFCLGDDDEDFEGAGQICYTNIPAGVHRALSNFNLNDYKKLDIDDEVEKKEIPLTPEDINKLVPGMWLKCLYDTDDTKLYEAMFLTSDANQMGPDVEGVSIIGHNIDSIGIEYDREELDEGDDAQKWVPISWCVPYGYKVYETEVEYMIEDNVKELFHRAFKDLSNKQRVSTDDTYGKVLFTYSQQGGTVAKNEDGYLATGWKETPLPAEMDTSQYNTVYTHLPFAHPAVQQVDNKFKLYQLYKDDPLASAVFPKSYSSYADALEDTKEGGESIFYVKDAGAARGEDIYIKTRDELAKDYQELKEEGEYDVDEGEGDVIIQKAVTDLYTIQGDGILSKRRFDIRYYVIIAHGKVYLHSFMLFRWSLGPKYDPKNTNVKTQVINVAAYGGGEMSRLFFLDAPHNDALGHPWTNNKRKRRNPPSNHAPRRRRADPHGWRDAVADALDDASSVFSNLKEITKNDHSKYVLAGGDAMIREDGSAVIVEFNVWPDLAVSYSSLSKCLAEDKGCRRMVLQTSNGSDDMDTDNYVSTEPSPASSIASTEGLSEVFRDMLTLVMKIRPDHDIEGLRQIEAKSWGIVDLQEGKRIQDSTQIQSLSNVMEVCDGVTSLLGGSSNMTQALSCPSHIHNVSVHPLSCVVLDTSNSNREIINVFSLERDPTVQGVASKFLWHRIFAMVIVLGVMFLFDIGARKVSRSQIILFNVVIAVIAVASDVIPRQDGKWFSHLNTSEIIKESFNAFYHVHPLKNTSVAISHFLTYWIHAAQWIVKSPRKVLIYALVTEVVVQLVNEWVHHYESMSLRCTRQSFIYGMTQSVYDEIWREFILGPFFVYFSLLPRFALHWVTQLLG